MPTKKKSLRSLQAQVDSFGFNLSAINVMQKIMPKKSARVLTRTFASFLHAAESREEFKWTPFADAVLGLHFPSPIVIRRVRSVTFALPGVKYTPDFNYVLDDGTRVNVEVKGSWFQRNYRDTTARQKMAATLFYDQSFIEVMPNKDAPNGWQVTHHLPDQEYGELFAELYQILQAEKNDVG